MNGNQLALRPLRHFADFSGRSSRAELVWFSLLLTVFYIPAAAADLIFGASISRWVLAGTTLLFLCPILALCVRRLHDVGWSGWWLLLTLPALALGGWIRAQQLLHPLVYPPASLPVPYLARLATTGLALTVMILLMWNEDPKANRYGPNPRHGPRGEPA